MQRRIFGKLAAGLGLSAGLLGSGALQAQESHALFANKTPLRLVVGYPPGGATDRVARIVAERLQARLAARSSWKTSPVRAAVCRPST